MTKKTIPELDDGNNPILSGLETLTHVSVDGVSKKLPFMPKPKNVIFARNQADLEASILGVNLEVPDGETVAVSIYNDVPGAFILSKPFLIGDESVLEIYGAIAQAELQYVGAGAMFRNTNPANPIESLFVRDIFLIGSTLNSMFDLVVAKFFTIDRIQGFIFADLGQVTSLIVDINQLTLTNITQGLRCINCTVSRVYNSGIQNIITIDPPLNYTDTDITLVSFRSSIPSVVTIDEVSAIQLHPGDSVVFCDPNSLQTAYTIEKSTIPLFGGVFYQSGADIAINGVVDNGSGNAQYTTSTPHGLVVGRMVVLSGFATETQNNGTFIVTAVDTPVTGVSFDTELVFAGGTVTGNLNQSSIDTTDVRINAERNPGQPDSMSTGDSGLEVFATPISSSSLAQDAFEVITSASWAFSNLERFSIGVNTEGQLIANAPSTRRYAVSFSGTIEKSGGGALDIGIVVLKNSSIVSFNPPHTVNSGAVQISGSDIIELTATDTIQLAVINYNTSAAIIILSQASLVVSLA